jgi:hypothetical protein
MLLAGLCFSKALAGSIIVRGKLVEMTCKRGRYTCKVELTNGNRYVQHPSIYVKLVKIGLYGEECVEFVEYIPELPPKSSDTYVIPLKTSCKMVVKPFFQLMPKRMKTRDWEKKVESWAKGCPARMVLQGK